MNLGGTGTSPLGSAVTSYRVSQHVYGLRLGSVLKPAKLLDLSYERIRVWMSFKTLPSKGSYGAVEQGSDAIVCFRLLPESCKSCRQSDRPLEWSRDTPTSHRPLMMQHPCPVNAPSVVTIEEQQ